jgi:dihydrofolate synthase/folylpolyglutamate synthase
MKSDADAYAATLERLYALVRFGEKLGLDGPRALDRALGGPVGRVPAILIGGTNGKGSTAAFVEALLRGRGFRTGLFTSPHLVSFRERIRIDGEDIAPAAVVSLADRVFAASERVGGEVPFFEIVWGMAALAFAEASVDFAIWEVGLGGRLDATNACEPLVSAVVSLGLDHTAVLGPDLPSIAREKAPIFRPGRPALTAASGESLEVLRAASAEGVELRVLGRDFAAFDGALPLPGVHQGRNAGLALEIVRSLGIRPDPTQLAQVRWPGRGEHIAPGLVLDCAHNPDGAAALAAWLASGDRAGPAQPTDLIVGMMGDKDVDAVVATLRPHARTVTCVTPGHPRALPAEALAARIPGPDVRVVPDVGAAIAGRDPGARTVLTGSCYLVGEARAAILGLPYPEAGLRTVAR